MASFSWVSVLVQLRTEYRQDALQCIGIAERQKKPLLSRWKVSLASQPYFSLFLLPPEIKKNTAARETSERFAVQLRLPSGSRTFVNHLLLQFQSSQCILLSLRLERRSKIYDNLWTRLCTIQALKLRMLCHRYSLGEGILSMVVPLFVSFSLFLGPAIITIIMYF